MRIEQNLVVGCTGAEIPCFLIFHYSLDHQRQSHSTITLILFVYRCRTAKGNSKMNVQPLFSI
jgi:hypothetical protein